jgi:hypothetical protein
MYVGLNVVYVDDAGIRHAALVTAVHSEECVNLVYFPDNGASKQHVTSVCFNHPEYEIVPNSFEPVGARESYARQRVGDIREMGQVSEPEVREARDALRNVEAD